MSGQPLDWEPEPVTVPPDEAQFIPAFTVQAGLANAQASAQGLGEEE